MAMAVRFQLPEIHGRDYYGITQQLWRNKLAEKSVDELGIR
jgi:hypothetical protein